MLAEAGLIAEAPELARDRRERWWRRIASTLSFSSADFGDDVTAETVARAAASINVDYQLTQLRAWDQSGDKDAWPAGPFSVDSWMRVDDAELAEFSSELTALIRRWADRELPDDGRERSTVFVFAHGVPGTP